MSLLPRVSVATRERISLEFDNLGPDVCVTETAAAMRQNNPEVFDMARRAATDLAAPAETAMVGIAMFYRLLVAQAGAELALPRVSRETRAGVVRDIDAKGPETFVSDALAGMERDNPELLQMAHRFASRQRNYLGTMEAFALLYATLAAQAAADRASMH